MKAFELTEGVKYKCSEYPENLYRVVAGMLERQYYKGSSWEKSYQFYNEIITLNFLEAKENRGGNEV